MSILDQALFLHMGETPWMIFVMSKLLLVKIPQKYMKMHHIWQLEAMNFVIGLKSLMSNNVTKVNVLQHSLCIKF